MILAIPDETCVFTEIYTVDACGEIMQWDIAMVEFMGESWFAAIEQQENRFEDYGEYGYPVIPETDVYLNLARDRYLMLITPDGAPGAVYAYWSETGMYYIIN